MNIAHICDGGCVLNKLFLDLSERYEYKCSRNLTNIFVDYWGNTKISITDHQCHQKSLIQQCDGPEIPQVMICLRLLSDVFCCDSSFQTKSSVLCCRCDVILKFELMSIIDQMWDICHFVSVCTSFCKRNVFEKIHIFLMFQVQLLV